MYFVSATRLRLRSVFYLPAFFRSSMASEQELLQTPGFIAGKEKPDKGLVFWTVSVWESDSDMKVFRNGAAHRKSMQKLPDWCNEATYVHWLQDTAEVPVWQVIYDKMITEGKITKVRNPTKNHADKNFAPPKWAKAEKIIRRP